MGKTLKRIIGYVRPYKKYLLAAVIFSLLGVSLSLFVPILIGRGVDFIVGENAVDFKELAKLAAVLAGIVLVSTFFQWLTALATNKLSYNTIRDIRTELFDTLNGVPLKFIDKSSKGELISRAVNDIEIISDGLLQGFTQLFSGIITILGTLVFMLTINIKNSAACSYPYSAVSFYGCKNNKIIKEFLYGAIHAPRRIKRTC